MKMAAANTRSCFSEFIGQSVVGVIFDALPPSNRDVARGTKTLIFDDGRGLTFASNGSYWIDNADDVRRAIRRREQELRATESELVGVLALAGKQAER